MNKRKKILLIIIISVILLLLVGGTYAWYAWTTSSDDEIQVLAGIEAANIVYTDGSNISGVRLKPTETKEGGFVKEIGIFSTEDIYYTLTFDLYLDILSLPEGLRNASFKYAIYSGDTLEDEGNFSQEYLDSHLEECTINTGESHILLLDNEEITSTKTKYQLYLWIDGNMDNPNSMQGLDFSFKLHAYGENAVMHEGVNTNIIHNDVIPVGGKYITGAVFDEDAWEWDMSNTTTYNAGDNFPDTVEYGDIYIYGDYEYRYGMSWCYDCMMWGDGCYDDKDGWGVAVLDQSKERYGDIVSVINGEAVTNLNGTFGYCEKLILSPEIPVTIKYMNGTFHKCINLIKTSKLPNGLVEMPYTFSYNKSLLEAPSIPNTVTTLEGTFEGCTGLTEAPVIPNSVTYMGYTFSRCTNLTGTVRINSSKVTYVSDIFTGTSKAITVEVPAGSTTYSKLNELTTSNGKPSNVTLITF